MKRRLIIVLILLLLLGGGFALYRHLHPEQAAEDALTLYGNVEIRSVELGFRVGGRLQAVAVEEGDRVRPGQQLALLDAGPYRDELALAEARQAQAAAQLAKLEAGSRPQQIVQAEALVRERRATLADLQLDFQRQRNLLTMNAVSRQAFDAATARLKEARARLATAEAGLKLAREGFRAEDVAAGKADLQAAAAATASAKTRLADTRLLSPAVGTILTRVAEPGTILAPGQTVLSLALDTPTWVRAYVDEPQLGLVHPGMAAEILTDSAPHHPYRGHVGFISPEAEFTPKTVQTAELRTRLVYQLRIVADNPDRGLRQGMPVTVRLLPDAEKKGQP